LTRNYVPLRIVEGGFLPKEFDIAHDLCFVIHGAMGAILCDGETAVPMTGCAEIRQADEIR